MTPSSPMIVSFTTRIGFRTVKRCDPEVARKALSSAQKMSPLESPSVAFLPRP